MPIASELSIDNTASALTLAQTIFGSGVSVTSATLTGAAMQSGTFSGGDATLGDIAVADTGIILSTGDVAAYTNSSGTLDTNTSAGTSTDHGTAGDADLDAISSQTTFDAVTLNVDFTATSAGYLTMQFTFSSEEYLEYVNSGVNDAFGVWVNGTHVPFSPAANDLVSIDSINNLSSSNLYLDNPSGSDIYNTEMDGTTIVLSLKAPINSGANTLKIALADGGDSSLDSNVLIAANSVQAVALAFDDTVTLEQNSSITIDVRDNDFDETGGGLDVIEINGNPISVGTPLTLPTGEIITLNADGTLTVENDGDIGSEVFTYTVENSLGDTDVGYLTINTVADLPLDFIVEGTGGDDTINAAYTGDPEGDQIDNLDHSDGSNDDSIEAGAGNDDVMAGAGDDTVIGGTGNDTIYGDDGDGVGASGAEFITNGSFEDGTHQANGVNGLTGWSNTSGSPDSADDGTTAESWNPANAASDGTGYITMWANSTGPNESMQQTLATPLDAGTSYTLTVNAISADQIGGQWFTPTDIPVEFELIDQTTGTVLGSVTVQGTSYGSYTFDFTPPTSVSTIIIRPNSAGSGTYPSVIIDELSIVETSSGVSSNDSIDAGDGDDVVFGEEGDDTILGGAGADSLDGDGGSDSIDGGTGNDTLIGDNGNDTLSGGADDDEIYVSSGDNLIDGGSGSDDIFAGTGNDTIDGGTGADVMAGAGGDDIFTLNDDFGADTISGGETGETGGDTLDLSAITDDLTLDLTSANPETGSISDGTDTASFVEIENIILGGGRDTLVLADGSGADTVEAFDLSDSGDGTANDQLDVSGLTSDGGTTPVTTDDVTVTDDGSGNAVLTFPGGESITLIGVAPTSVDSAAELEAIGIPAVASLNYIVEGTSGADNITVGYAGDPEGDMIDNADNLAGNDADSILAGAGDDTIHSFFGDDTIDAGTGNDWAAGYDGNDYIDGGDGNDELHGGEGSDTLIGGIGDDSLNGDNGDDSLVGGDGADTFTGGAGADTIEGGNDNDTIYGQSGGDSINGDAGDDVIYGEADNDAINGGDGNDGIDGGTGDDTLYGGMGNDTLLGGDGADSLFGNEDNDSIEGGAGNDTVEAGTGNDTIIGGDGDDSISGDFGDDLIIGGAGDDFLRGSFGNDTITGGTGADTLWGGFGDDVFNVAADFGTYIIEGEEEDETVGDTMDLSNITNDLTIDLSNANPEAGTFTDGTNTGSFVDIENIVLGSGDDTLVLSTFGGSDSVIGFSAPTDTGGGTFSGNDQLDVSGLLDFDSNPTHTGNVTVTEVGGNAVLTFANGESLTLVGVPAADVSSPAQLIAMGIPEGPDGYVDGTAGDDVIDSTYAGDPNFDRVDSNDAQLPGMTGDDDYIRAGDGNDSVLANAGDDIAEGGAGNDTLDGGVGADTLRGDAGDDSLIGGLGDDSLIGGLGDDSLIGGLGDDSLVGGTGDDTLNGQIGDDVLEGGDGSDSFALEDDFGNDTIVGGEVDDAVGDVLDMSGVGGGLSYDLTGTNSEAGTVSDGTNTLEFSEIEDIRLSSGIDTLILADGSGNDTVSNFTAPFDDGFGTWVGIDQVDVSGMTDANGAMVNTGDVTISDTNGDGTGDVILTFPGGESLTLVGVLPSAFPVPEALAAIGIPLADYIVEGTAAGELIDGNYLGDPEGDLVDAGDGDPLLANANSDSIEAGDGDDTVYAGAGDDTVYGGADDDEIHGGDGDDTLIGDEGDDLIFGGAGSDSVLGGAGDDIINGMTGSDYLEGGADSDTFVIEDGFGSDTIVGGETVTTGVDIDTIQVNGASITTPVTVTFTGDEAGTLSDGTDTLEFSGIERIELGATSDTINGAADGVGINVDAGAGDDFITGGSGIDTIVAGTGNDVISGGAEGDSITAGAGDDTINVAQGDTVTGGDGDDFFNIVDLGEIATGTITIVGGEGGETDGDTLALNGLHDRDSLTITDPDDVNGGLSGTVTLLDGTVVNFTNIENIICFVPGTEIATPFGARMIEDLKIGDQVVTQDNGIQRIRWIGTTTVPANDSFAPVRFSQSAFPGASGDLVVSPQHRMLFKGYQAELLFGETEVLIPAIHLVDGDAVRRESLETVTYIHIMFEQHEIIFAQGVATESFHPGSFGVDCLAPRARDELFSLFPNMRSDLSSYGQSARTSLKAHEAKVLMRF
ncbi:MAG: choice-of-anchor L domain-containing protein [Planktotalea sp.]|uniref:choice-of-anchor L domain-containing protein n=1 Tax=Planktotalea sp. TaxID=2029877 RepID=UPI003C77444B